MTPEQLIYEFLWQGDSLLYLTKNFAAAEACLKKVVADLEGRGFIVSGEGPSRRLNHTGGTITMHGPWAVGAPPQTDVVFVDQPVSVEQSAADLTKLMITVIRPAFSPFGRNPELDCITEKDAELLRAEPKNCAEEDKYA
jgi:hypothetical protein